MTEFTDTYLWMTTLDEQAEDKGAGMREARGRLRTAYMNFRDRAKTVAGEIPRDLPDYTVHDVSHLDALWEMAGLVAGSDYPLNAMEAFVLGGAFLVHDLGMALAAYPENIEALRNHRGWEDAVTALWHPTLGRLPTAEELQNPPAEIERLAAAEMLRDLHARRADRLAFISWQADGGATYHLIESPELRGRFGSLIGRIAHSHWWPVDRLKEEFASRRLGAPTGYPPEWTVDPLKLACLLRLADVAHVDARRAPGFLRALRKPQGIAREH